MRRALLALPLLAACGEEPAPPAPAASFRDPGAPIGSTTRGRPADLAGDWVVSAAYPGGGFWPVAPGDRIAIEMDAAGAGTWRLHSAGGVTVAALSPTGPGRFAPTGIPGSPLSLWVLWTDDAVRTAVLGTPDGSFGWIMDRPDAAAPDRAEAAREMLDFNGYDLARLAP